MIAFFRSILRLNIGSHLASVSASNSSILPVMDDEPSIVVDTPAPVPPQRQRYKRARREVDDDDIIITN